MGEKAEEEKGIESDIKKPSIISWDALQRIQSVMRGHSITEDEIDYALSEIYVYGALEEGSEVRAMMRKKYVCRCDECELMCEINCVSAYDITIGCLFFGETKNPKWEEVEEQ